MVVSRIRRVRKTPERVNRGCGVRAVPGGRSESRGPTARARPPPAPGVTPATSDCGLRISDCGFGGRAYLTLRVKHRSRPPVQAPSSRIEALGTSRLIPYRPLPYGRGSYRQTAVAMAPPP